MLSQKTWGLLFCVFAILVLIGVVNAQISNSGIYSSSVIELEPMEEDDSGFFLWDFIIDLFKSEPKTQASVRVIPLNQEVQEINLIGDLNEDNSEIVVEDLTLSTESSKKSSRGSSQKSSSKKPSSATELLNDDNMQDEIITRNGTKYIIRDGKEYLLSPAGPSSDYYIEFDPDLPNAVCEYEEIDITVKGVAKFLPDAGDVIYCISHDYISVSWCVRIMEADFLTGDDEVEDAWGCGIGAVYCPIELDDNWFYFEKTLEDVDLSSEIVPDPGDNGEFYAKIYDFNDKVYPMSTDTFDVYGYINGECECISGACCDLAGGRPYDLKPYGSQPTNYEDFYYCTAESSPTGTNYIKERDWYCNGVDWTANYVDTHMDTCGYCEYCPSNSPTCGYYSQGTPCGSGMICDGSGSCVADCECSSGVCCDGCYYRSSSYICDSQYAIDYGCPNGEGTSYPGSDVYKRVKQRYCSGSSTSCSGSISDWLSWNVYDYCSSDEYCIDDYSYCHSCGYHVTYTCFNNDVYWYDYCFNLEDKKEECGDDENSGGRYCCLNDVCQNILDRGCRSGACYEDLLQITVEYCGENGCLNGQCVGAIECYSNSDCGTDGWVGSPICSSNDVYQNWRTYTCSNSGTPSSDCSYNDVLAKKQECGNDEYSDNYCYDNDVYRDFIDRGCSTGSCFETTTRQKVEECGINGCSNGQCVADCECSSGVCCDGCYYRPSNYVCNSEYTLDYGCPNGEGTSYPGSDVYKRVKQRYCSGSSTSCSGSISDWLSWNVYDYCSSDEYCTDNDPSCNSCGYHINYACYSNDVYWYDNCLNREDKKEECSNTPCIQRVCAGEIFEQALNLGWNDVTFDTLLPLDNSIENVLASIEGKYDNVWAYVDGEWLSYSPTVLPSMNTLLYIEEGMIISIEMNQAATLSFVYFPGTLYDKNYWCEYACSTNSVYDFCTSTYHELEIEGEILEGSCNYFVTEYPFLGIQPCDRWDCP